LIARNSHRALRRSLALSAGSHSCRTTTSDAATQSQNNRHDQSTTTPKAAKAQEEPLTLGTAVLGVLALFLIAATAPFMAGTSNIIGLLIIAFGLFEAWKINKRVAITMSGPFSVTPVAPPSPDV
jgi:hypothetical protein